MLAPDPPVFDRIVGTMSCFLDILNRRHRYLQKPVESESTTQAMTASGAPQVIEFEGEQRPLGIFHLLRHKFTRVPYCTVLALARIQSSNPVCTFGRLRQVLALKGFLLRQEVAKICLINPVIRITLR